MISAVKIKFKCINILSAAMWKIYVSADGAPWRRWTLQQYSLLLSSQIYKYSPILNSSQIVKDHLTVSRHLNF